MARGKGPGGMTTVDALGKILPLPGTVISAKDLFEEVKQLGQGAWTDDHVWQEIMSRTVNLVPAYYHWNRIKQEDRFLFLHEDALYERYDPNIHGIYGPNGKVS